MSSDELSWGRVEEAMRAWRYLKRWKPDEVFGRVIVEETAIAELVELGFSFEEAQASRVYHCRANRLGITQPEPLTLCETGWMEEWLRELEHREKQPVEAPKPRWDAVPCKLWLGSVLVKEFRPLADNAIPVLTAFQERDWPYSVDDPNWGKHFDDEQSYGVKDKFETIHTLNNGAKGIRFFGPGETKKIAWSVGDKLARPSRKKGKNPRN
jgi:hypothetical protein